MALKKLKSPVSYYQRGFTLLEVLIIVVVVGVLASLIVPGWLRFLTAHQVTAGKDQLRQGIQKAQLKSQQESISWQVSVREKSDVVEMAVHPTTTSPNMAIWDSLNEFVQLDGETNFATSGGVYYVRFDEKGNVRYRLGRVTLSGKNFPDIKRCVIVSTLIGNTRAAKENSEQEDGRYCY